MRATVKTDKVVNPYGSAAGAGSGEFHVYRHARSREMERLKGIDEMDETQRKDHEFQQEVAQYQQEAEERTKKKRKKRQRQKEAKQRKKNLEKVGFALGAQPNETGANDEEFTYTPANVDGTITNTAEEPQSSANHAENDDSSEDEGPAPLPPKFSNDRESLAQQTGGGPNNGDEKAAES